MINRATEYSLHQIMTSKGYDYAGKDRVIYKGGPVNTTALVMLHSDDWYSSNTMPITAHTSISSDNFMMEKLAFDNAPASWRMVLGVSGWAPGQLDNEISRGDWLLADSDPDILWGYDGEKQWRRSLDLCSQQMLAQYF
jgi:putative transcriptional regulator